MPTVFHILVVLTAITGQPVLDLDMTRKEGVSTFETVEACRKAVDAESFQLAVEDFRKMMMERLHMPLLSHAGCTPGPPRMRPEGYA